MGAAPWRNDRDASHRASLPQVGWDRVVYATDWPAWPLTVAPADGISANVDLVMSALPLSDDELARIMSNVSAVFGGLPN